MSSYAYPGQRVLGVHRFRLDGGPVPEVAITLQSTGRSLGATPAEDLVMLAWDAQHRHWQELYDAARDGTVPGEPDAPMLAPPPTPPTAEPVLPHLVRLTGLTVAELRNQPGGRGDLVFWADEYVAGGEGPAIGIVRFDSAGLSAWVAWSYHLSEGGRVSVIGPPGRQELAVSGSWQTPVDPLCCPLRGYRFVLARSSHPDVEGKGYRAVSDSRPWLGAFVAQRPARGNGAAEVTGVVPGSPAAGVLYPGDLILGAAGASQSRGNLLGPAVVDQVDIHQPGATIRLRIQRQGVPRTVTVTLGSLADPAAARAVFPAAGGPVIMF